MMSCLKYEEGSILGIAMIYFLIFSITGMAVLTLAAHWRTTSQDEVHVTKNRYAVESILNLALWRINHGPDSLANFNEDGATSLYNDSTLILTVSSNKWNKPHQVSVEIEPDYPFSHGLSYLYEPDDTTKGSITTLPGHGLQKFDFFPNIDTSYLRQNAVQIYTSGDTTIKDTLPSGIHYVEGGKVTLKKGAYLEGSLVIMGKLKIKDKNVILRAITDSAGAYIPVLVVTDTADISSNPNVVIQGPVFSEGHFNIKGGIFTGPVVASSIKLRKNLVIDDEEDEKYYVWPRGFGSFYSYDWPKDIKAGTWRN